ncbi:hypothetical protein DBR32_09620 [Taibaiella sp. KBW10]|nr:hypothetical protein DBR32_09620 [Taibaiella sp. KBW10]
MLIVAGIQEPVIPLIEVVGKGGILEPIHFGVTRSKYGCVLGFTCIVMVAGSAQVVLSGVKV